MATLSDYLNLIPPPNSIQPNFMAWMQAVLTPFYDTLSVCQLMQLAYNIDLAVGTQLDVLGAVLGLPRTVAFQPSGGVSPVLTDDNYRIVLKAKAIQNQWSGQKGQLLNFFSRVFPTNPIFLTDNQDMTMSVVVIGFSAGIQQDLVSNGYFIPKPSGVRITYTFTSVPLFAYDYDTTYFKGYDAGSWAGL